MMVAAVYGFLRERKMNVLRPLGSWIVVRPDDLERQSKGGIAYPDTMDQRSTKGKVVAVGPGRLLDDGSRAGAQVAEGDVVLFGKYSGSNVELDGGELLMIKEDEILAVVEVAA